MKLVKTIFFTAGVTLVSGAAFLAAAAACVVGAGALPKTTLPVLATGACCTGTFLGALVLAALRKEKGIWWGLGWGAVVAAALAGGAVFFFPTAFGPAALGRLSAIILSGTIGGILGVNRKKRVKF